MENAVKALQIAASVLIALIILGFVVYGYNNLSKAKQAEQDRIKIEQANDFNKIFESYNKETLQGSQLMSLVNKVDDNNKKYNLEIANGPEDKYHEVQISITFVHEYFHDSANHITPGRYPVNSHEDQLVRLYNDSLREIYEMGKLSVTGSVYEGSNNTFTYQQIQILPDNIRRKFLESLNQSERDGYDTYNDLVIDQKDLLRSTFERVAFTYDVFNGNSYKGRILGIEFRER